MDRRYLLAALVAATPLILAACGGKEDSLPFTSTTQGISTPLASLDDCPLLAANVTEMTPGGQIVITRACFKDDLGKYYDALYSDGPLPPGPGLAVLPGGRKYSFVLQFSDAWIPPASVTSNADAGAAYAAVDNIYSNDPCMQLPEDNPANRVPTTTTLEGNTLTVSLVNTVPDGEQVVPIVNFAALYPSIPACSYETFSLACINFNGRFYVAYAPPVDTCALDASVE